MVRAAIIGLIFFATPCFALEDRSYFEIWEDEKDDLRAKGLTRQIFLLMSIYLEGRYLAGYCSEYLSDDVLDSWGLPDDLPEKDEIERSGIPTFRAGLRDGVRNPPTASQCDNAIYEFGVEIDAIRRDLEAERMMEKAK